MLFKPHNEVQSCRRLLPLGPSSPSFVVLLLLLLPAPYYKSFKPDFGRVEPRQVEVDRSQAPDCSPLAGSYLSIVLFSLRHLAWTRCQVEAGVLSKQSAESSVMLSLFLFSHPHSLSLPCEVQPRSKTWKSELFSCLDCGATLDLSECCK